jgi:glycerol-3-phosphate O-acyltransferase/dihydroxyacetone phosphate acyltransferase
MQAQISLGTIDAPSWDIIQTSKTAIRIYAPLGTSMSLGDYIRVLRTFVDAFTSAVTPSHQRNGSSANGSFSTDDAELSTDNEGEDNEDVLEVARLLQVRIR